MYHYCYFFNLKIGYEHRTTKKYLNVRLPSFVLIFLRTFSLPFQSSDHFAFFFTFPVIMAIIIILFLSFYF